MNHKAKNNENNQCSHNSPDVSDDEKITNMKVKHDKLDYYDTLGGKLPTMEVINENICEESLYASEKRLNKNKNNQSNHHTNHTNHNQPNPNKKKDPLSLWKKLKIEDIIPKAKLNSKDDNTIYFKGDLFKYATPQSNLSNQLAYKKFFVLDRKYFS